MATESDFTASVLSEQVHEIIARNEWPMGQVMNSLRLAVVGASRGPDMFEICAFIGRDEILRRIDRALDVLGN
jgi:glutamyl-tRNA synthetase